MSRARQNEIINEQKYFYFKILVYFCDIYIPFCSQNVFLLNIIIDLILFYTHILIPYFISFFFLHRML